VISALVTDILECFGYWLLDIGSCYVMGFYFYISRSIVNIFQFFFYGISLKLL
jgi:hypothetical protein